MDVTTSVNINSIGTPNAIILLLHSTLVTQACIVVKFSISLCLSITTELDCGMEQVVYNVRVFVFLFA